MIDRRIINKHQRKNSRSLPPLLSVNGPYIAEAYIVSTINGFFNILNVPTFNKSPEGNKFPTFFSLDMPVISQVPSLLFCKDQVYQNLYSLYTLFSVQDFPDGVGGTPKVGHQPLIFAIFPQKTHAIGPGGWVIGTYP